MKQKRGQAGTEYLIIVAFVTFAVMAIIAIAVGVSNTTKDKLKVNQIESFMAQLINAAESVFFSGEPSKTTTSLYLPDGVTNITIYSDSILVKYLSYNGESVRVFSSRVPLNGTISSTEGTKRLLLQARADFVQITPVSS